MADKKPRSTEAQKLDFCKNPDKFIADHMANRHMWEAHEETSRVKMLNNILKPGRIGGKYADSQFRRAQNRDLGADCVRQLLTAHFDEIQAYVQKYRENPETTPDSELFHMEFTTTTPDGRKIPDYVGVGYRMTSGTSTKYNGSITGVELIKTNAVACIVRPSVDNEDGWEITSAFPMASPRDTEITAHTSIEHVDRDFQELLHKTFTYQNASPVMKAYLDTTCSGKPLDQKYRTEYSPGTSGRTPVVMIMPNNRHPEFKSEYPRITIYANENPPADATLILSKDKRMRLGSERSRTALEKENPEMLALYDQFITKLPDEYHPDGKYHGPEKPAARLFQDKPAPSAKLESTPIKSSRDDPHFDMLANEIQSGAKGPEKDETQFT